MLTTLVFDWGRRGELSQDYNNSATGTVQQDNSLISNSSIVVNSIKENQEVASPIQILGEARGNWFFEATFPVKLVDIDGNVMATSTARAESDWMTGDFVKFNATLEYATTTSTNHALIVLSKDNPSGNPEFDQSIFIPVILK